MRLTEDQLRIAQLTMSGGTFYHIVMHQLTMCKSLSVVRMGDGECMLLAEAAKRKSTDKIDLFEEAWNKRMGVDGMTYGDLQQRLRRAVAECDYFAPSINGIVNEKFNLFKYFNHSRLVDNFFVNQWSADQRKDLFDAADGILLIHNSLVLADEFQKRLSRFRVNFIQLSDAAQSEDVLAKAKVDRSQLVLFSAGPCAKYIGPAIARGGKVALDIGNTMPNWLPSAA